MIVMKKLNFVTLVPKCGNTELIKDVGQIPYVLGKKYKLNTVLVSSRIDMSGENISAVKELKLVHVPLILGSIGLTGVWYILFHAKEIDWLNIYHAGRKSYSWAKIFKMLNPKGKIYLKLDLDFISCEKYDTDLYERRLFSENTKIIDLVSCETQIIKERIQKYSERDIKVIGNGYYKTEFEPSILQNRDDCFITVGRLGTMQKATEVLLEAFALSSNKHSWNLKLLGNVEEEFKPFIEDFYKNYPELKNRVLFYGQLNNREQLYNEYCKSKVFVLPSRWESFGIVGGEALSCGCRIIVSNKVPPMKEMTNEERYGRIVPVDNIEALSDAMLEATTRKYDEIETKEIVEYAKKIFSWDSICQELNDYLVDIPN